MKHTCEQIYEIGANNKVYGSEKGVCRITGKESEGLLFSKWVKKTFNDHDYLFPGTTISNEALFCFDESSEIVQKKTGKEKPQRFRTYSHIIKDSDWYCVGWPEDWSVRGIGNKLMRNVPLKQDGRGFMYGMRPSYWNPRHIAVCKMP